MNATSDLLYAGLHLPGDEAATPAALLKLWRSGLQTKAGASAVGESATSAVVSCIIMLVVVDGLFALAYYVLNI